MRTRDAIAHDLRLRARGDVDDREHEPELPALLEVGDPPRQVIDWCARCDRRGPITAPDGLCAACAGLLLLPAAS